MTEESAPATAVGSPVVAAIRSQGPEFDEAFLRALDAEGEQDAGGEQMGAFQAISVFAEWVEGRVEHSPQSPDVRRALTAVEEIASSNQYLMGRELVTEFVEALAENPTAVSLMGPETLRFH